MLQDVQASEVHEVLSNKFVEIVERHGNAIWALQELEWLVYTLYRDELNASSDEVQSEVDHYMSSLRKIYG